jgi:hypothetical protein
MYNCYLSGISIGFEREGLRCRILFEGITGCAVTVVYWLFIKLGCVVFPLIDYIGRSVILELLGFREFN